MLTVNHPWHGAHYGENAPEKINALIEIPQGSRAKYEVDRRLVCSGLTGLSILPSTTRSIMVLYPKHSDRMATHWIFWYYVPNPYNRFAL